MTGEAETALRSTPLRRDIPRWMLAAVAVAAAHAALAYGIVAFAPVRQPDALEQAMTVDLTPLVLSEARPVEEAEAAVAQEETETVTEIEEEPVEQEVAESTEEETETPEEVQPEEVTETPETPPETQETTETPPETAETAQEEEVELPETVDRIPEVRQAEVVLPKPKVVEPERRKPRRTERTKPDPKPVVERAEAPRKKRAAKAEERPRRSASSARAGSSTPKAVSADAMARWKSRVYAVIKRRQRPVRGESGQVSVRFVVSPAGAIVSAAVSRSSGSPALDSMALSMVRGARVPAPPDKSTRPVLVPIVFQ